MMKRKKQHIALLSSILGLISLSSCIQEDLEPCPPLHVNIDVKDKNYFNVDKVEQEERKSEDLAFREYVPTLYYQLRDAATGKVLEEQGVFEVMGDNKVFPVTFCDCIPYGKYVLTVWGGLEDDTPLDEDHTTVTFHLNQAEGHDIYMTNDTLLYDLSNNDQTVELERAKGKLIIQAVGLPDDVNYSEKTIDGLYQSLDCEFNYSETTSVHTQIDWGAKSEILTKTILSPSVKEKNSKLHVDLYKKQAGLKSSITPKDVNITMKRNELTVLKYVYDDTGSFTIYVLMNDAWDIIYDMGIE